MPKRPNSSNSKEQQLKLLILVMLLDTGETDETLRLYGLERGTTQGFGWQCLVARRLAERGVRFVELIDVGSSNNWDSHGNMADHEKLARAIDQPIAGLITDPGQGLGIPFMLVGPLLAVLCVAIYVVTSLLTPAMNPVEVAKVCWDHPLAFLKGRLTGASDPRAVTLILLAVVGVLYLLLR